MTERPWLIYSRVSTEDQVQGGVSMDSQLTSCRAYCTARGWTISHEISDPGISAATLKRPGMSEVLALLRGGTVAGVIAWRLDRLTRSMRDLLSLVDLAAEKGVGLVSVTEALDTTNPMGRFVVHLLGAIAQWERETIGARVASAMKHAKSLGWYTGGGIPAGLLVEKVGNRQRLVPGTDAAEVTKTWAMVLAGRSLGEVSDHLKRLDVKPSQRPGVKAKGWTPAAVHNLLKSRQAVGLLIDAQTQAAVLHELSTRPNPRRKGTRGRDPGKGVPNASPLAGLVRCPLCDGGMVMSRSRGNGGWYRQFRCSNRIKRRCPQKDVRAEPVEAEAIRAVGVALAAGGDYAKQCRLGLQEAVAGVAAAKVRRVTIATERDQLAARIGDLALHHQIGAPGWSQALAVIGKKLEAAERELAELDGTIAAGEVDLADLDLILGRISSGAANLADDKTIPPDQRAAIIRDLVHSIRVADGRTVLDLYPPRHVSAGGSESERKWYSNPHGIRTIRVTVARRSIITH